MTESGGFFLCGQHFAADRAVTALGKSGFGAGGTFRRVGDRGMTASRNGSYLFIAADGTSLCLNTAFCAGRLSGDNVFAVGVTESGDFFLCGQNFTANRAVTALGESGFGTSSVNCGVNDRRVTESRDSSINTTLTVKTFEVFTSVLRASCRTVNNPALCGVRCQVKNLTAICTLTINVCCHGFAVG